jgi:hypothetical protein
MKNRWLAVAALAGLGATAVLAADPSPAIIIYVDCDSSIPGAPVSLATARSAKIFAQIGLTVRFRDGRKPKTKMTGANEFEMYLENELPPDVHAAAVAHLYGLDGRIRVFYGSLKDYKSGGLLAVVLAYVMTHEITHVLEGISHHSPTGVMKAKWSREDFAKIEASRLKFDPQDIDLIRSGIEKRESDAREAGLNRTPSGR